jgi:hypothetical protein
VWRTHLCERCSQRAKAPDVFSNAHRSSNRPIYSACPTTCPCIARNDFRARSAFLQIKPRHSQREVLAQLPRLVLLRDRMHGSRNVEQQPMGPSAARRARPSDSRPRSQVSSPYATTLFRSALRAIHVLQSVHVQPITSPALMNCGTVTSTPFSSVAGFHVLSCC